MDRDCSTCEFFAHRRPPRGLARRPYCMGLGFFQINTAVAIDCRLYRARPGVTGHQGGF